MPPVLTGGNLLFPDVWIPFRNFGNPKDMSFNIYLVTGSAKIPAFLDATTYLGLPDNNSDPPYQEHDDRDFNMGRFCINRHNSYINRVFLDWSVRKVGLKELWTLKWSPDFDMAGPWTRAGGVHPEDWPEWMRNFKGY